MYEKILVPVDGSVSSWHALGHACALGKLFGSKITIIHVVEPYYVLPNEAIHGDTVSLTQVNIAAVEVAGKKILELATKKFNHCFSICSLDEPCYTILPGDGEGEMDEVDPNALELTNQNINSSAKLETRLTFGSPAKSIIALANEEHFNLIVMGSRGLSGLSEFLLGSVSNTVSHAALIPVLIVK